MAAEKIPQEIVSLLNCIGPLHETITELYSYRIEAIIQTGQDNTVIGFLLTQRAPKRQQEKSDLPGFEFRVPSELEDGTLFFFKKLEDALEFIREEGR